MPVQIRVITTPTHTSFRCRILLQTATRLPPLFRKSERGRVLSPAHLLSVSMRTSCRLAGSGLFIVCRAVSTQVLVCAAFACVLFYQLLWLSQSYLIKSYLDLHRTLQLLMFFIKYLFQARHTPSKTSSSMNTVLQEPGLHSEISISRNVSAFHLLWLSQSKDRCVTKLPINCTKLSCDCCQQSPAAFTNH